MKKIILSLCFYVLSVATLFGQKDLTLNTKISSVEWIGKKVTGEQKGIITIKEGTLQVKDNMLAGGNIIIDMETINSTDMQGEYKGKLEGHLKSADFFDVANYKTAALKITSVELLEGNKYTVVGDLTIKGITKPIEFTTTIEIKDGKLGAYAEMAIDRTNYNIKYGSGKFFEGLGDKMINDEFIIKFKIAAK